MLLELDEVAQGGKTSATTWEYLRTRDYLLALFHIPLVDSWCRAESKCSLCYEIHMPSLDVHKIEARILRKKSALAESRDDIALNLLDFGVKFYLPSSHDRFRERHIKRTLALQQ